ncbi:MAG: hypothetical protein ACREDK_00225 [Thermoplasmata archaeon]
MPTWTALAALVGGSALCAVGALTAVPGSPIALPSSPLPLGLLGVGALIVVVGATEMMRSRLPRPKATGPRATPPALGAAPPADGSPRDGAPWDEAARAGVPAANYPTRPPTFRVPDLPTVSIPGAVARSAWDESTDLRTPPPLPPPPFATSLPFSALEGGGIADRSSDPENPALQMEVDRLRREVEAHAHHRPPIPEVQVPAVERHVGWLGSHLRELGRGEHPELSLSRSGAVAKAALEPPAPRPSLHPPHRSCASCGAGLLGGSTVPCCAGCGRPLCDDCYWKPLDAVVRHRCVACAGRGTG